MEYNILFIDIYWSKHTLEHLSVVDPAAKALRILPPEAATAARSLRRFSCSVVSCSVVSFSLFSSASLSLSHGCHVFATLSGMHIFDIQLPATVSSNDMNPSSINSTHPKRIKKIVKKLALWL